MLNSVCRITHEDSRLGQAGSRLTVRLPPHSVGYPVSKSLRSQQPRPSAIDSVIVGGLGAS